MRPITPSTEHLLATDTSSVLIVAAHPDDEFIGATTVLLSVPNLTVLHVTDGSPADLRDAQKAGCARQVDYAALRRSEAEHALALAGRSPSSLLPLGFPDQGCVDRLSDLIEALAAVFALHRPDVVITHPYEGGHPDHDSVAFAVHAAVGLADHQPELIEMTSYHMGPAGIETGVFLAARGYPESSLPLTEREQTLKRAMLACFQSQRETLKCFGVGLERFRRSPEYDFSSPPHPGRLFYEGFPWGTTGARWRQAAAHAFQRFAPVPALADSDVSPLARL